MVASPDPDTGTATTEALLRFGAAKLAAAGVPEASVDAEWLLCHATGMPRSRLRLERTRQWPQQVFSTYAKSLVRRSAREPLQHVLGTQPFRRLTLQVSPCVLVPRPETELLVEEVLIEIRSRNLKGPCVVDLGTGSGAIALSIAEELPEAKVYATDLSPEALAVARRNEQRCLGQSVVTFLEGDLFGALEGLKLEGRIEALVCNPPYVATDDLASLEPEVRDHEPSLALDGGADGLAFYRRLSSEAGAWLAPRGFMACEIGYGQAEAVAAIYRAGGFTVQRIVPDCAGIPRAVIASLGGG